MFIIKNKIQIIKFKNEDIISTNSYKNLITTNGKNFIAKKIGSLSTDEIYYIGIGSGTTDVSASDTAIEDEIFRKQITELEVVGGDLKYTFYIEKSEAIGNWGNIGLITSEGILITHANISETKTSSDYITILYTIGG